MSLQVPASMAQAPVNLTMLKALRFPFSKGLQKKGVIDKVNHSETGVLLGIATKRKTQITPGLLSQCLHELKALEDVGPVFDATIDVIQSAQVFEFGRIELEKIPLKFIEHAFELFFEGVLRLPYKESIFFVDAVYKDDSAVRYMFALEQTEHLHAAVYIIRNVGGYKTCELMCHVGLDLTVHGDKLSLHFGWTEAADVGDSDAQREYVLAIMQVVMVCALMLNTKNMPMQRSPAMRLFNGVERKEAYITKVDSRVYLNAATTKKEKRGVSPHIRRGHIRRLPNGKKRWISDMLVGFNQEGKQNLDVRKREKYIAKPQLGHTVSEEASKPKHAQTDRPNRISRLKELFNLKRIRRNLGLMS